MAAAYATKAELLAFAPELPDTAQLQLWLTITQSMLRAAEWGDVLSDGHLTLAAHFCTVSLNPSAAGGPITARSIDKISESYAAQAIADTELGLTVYGRAHIALRDNLPTQLSTSDGNDPPDWALPDQRIH